MKGKALFRCRLNHAEIFLHASRRNRALDGRFVHCTRENAAIWYGCALNIVNTFPKAYDLSGKKIAAFATSGGSGIGKTADKLRPYVGGAEIIDAQRIQSAADVKAWADSL